MSTSEADSLQSTPGDGTLVDPFAAVAADKSYPCLCSNSLHSNGPVSSKLFRHFLQATWQLCTIPVYLTVVLLATSIRMHFAWCEQLSIQLIPQWSLVHYWSDPWTVRALNGCLSAPVEVTLVCMVEMWHLDQSSELCCGNTAWHWGQSCKLCCRNTTWHWHQLCELCCRNAIRHRDQLSELCYGNIAWHWHQLCEVCCRSATWQ